MSQGVPVVEPRCRRDVVPIAVGVDDHALADAVVSRDRFAVGKDVVDLPREIARIKEDHAPTPHDARRAGLPDAAAPEPYPGVAGQV